MSSISEYESSIISETENSDSTLCENLCMDYTSKDKVKLSQEVEKIREALPQVFDGYKEQDSIIPYLIKNIFPEGFSVTCFFSNTSLRIDIEYFTIRPRKEGLFLTESLPAGISFTFSGFVAQGVNSGIFYIQKIAVVSDSEKRDFEIEKNIIPHFAKNAIRNRKNTVFTPQFIAALPKISQMTAYNLIQWEKYIQWKKAIAQQKVAGIKYIKVLFDYTNFRIIFYTVSENEESFNKFIRYFRREELFAFDNKYSSDRWIFKFNDKDFNARNGDRSKYEELGDFCSVCKSFYLSEYKVINSYKGSSDIKRDNTPIDIINLKGLLEESSFHNPFISIVSFELPEDILNDYNNISEDRTFDFISTILSKYPQEGFLATSSTGDLALLSRQKQAIEILKRGTGYAPFLSSWLFDVTKANKIEQEFKVDKWLMKDINEEQKKTVEKMLGATDLFLLQGPPGTGKTTVIAEVIYQFARKGYKVLLASQANLAVDNALERLAAVPEIRAIRLGKNKKVSDDALKFTEDKAIEYFYKSIINGVEYNYLNQWKHLEEIISRLNKWLEDTEFVIEDINRYRNNLLSLKNKRLEAEALLKEEKIRIEEIKDKNSELENYKEELNRVQRYFNGEYELSFTLGNELIVFIYNTFIVLVNKLNHIHVNLNNFGDFHVSHISEQDKTNCIKEIMNNWLEFTGFIDKLKRDLQSLKNEQSNMNSDIQLRLELLRVKLKDAEKEMEDGVEKAVNEWRRLRAEINKLSARNNSFVNNSAMNYFTADYNDKPYYTYLSGLKGEDLYNEFKKILSEAEIIELSIKQSFILIQNKITEEINSCIYLPVDTNVLRLKKAEYERLMDMENECSASLKSKIDVFKIKKNEVMEHLKDNNIDDNMLLEHISNVVKALKEEADKSINVRRDWEPFFNKWITKLGNKKNIKYDNAFYKDIYMDSCNVVGITCTEKQSTLDNTNHTFFDVAIIDEVSKATPPELLIPMIRARKTILVGDHRQLPPLFKEHEYSYEEMINQIEEEGSEGEPTTLLTKENFFNFKEMVTASLFKTYFENADEKIKQSLFTQYRMHPDIMDVINSFYENKLICGLNEKTIENVRSHGLNITSPKGLNFITKERHAIWIDTTKDPCGKIAFEEQSNTSKVNELEAILIVEMLKKIDAEYSKSGYGKNKKKDIGVISFYGKQIKIIRQWVRKIKFSAIHVDVNTVDRFQGKEKSIILVSLVRNADIQCKAANAYVAAFERINVAFSRARELLLIFGAKDMFYNYPVKLPYMDNPGSRVVNVYCNIMDKLNRKACLFESDRVLTANEYTKNRRLYYGNR